MKRFVTLFIAALLFIMPSFSLQWRMIKYEYEDNTKGRNFYYFEHWPEAQDFIDVMAYEMKLPNVTAQVLYSGMKRAWTSGWYIYTKDTMSEYMCSLIEEKEHLITFEYDDELGLILLREYCDWDDTLFATKSYALVYDEGENNE